MQFLYQSLFATLALTSVMLALLLTAATASPLPSTGIASSSHLPRTEFDCEKSGCPPPIIVRIQADDETEKRSELSSDVTYCGGVPCGVF